MKKNPIITKSLHTLPVFMESSKYIYFDCDNKANIKFLNYQKRMIAWRLNKFNGKFINIPKKIQISLPDLLILVKEDNKGIIDLTNFFGNAKIFVNTGGFIARLGVVRKLKKTVNITFVDFPLNSFEECETIPPCLFIHFEPDDKNKIYLPDNSAKFDFGDSKRNWVFKNFTGRIILTKKSDINSLRELKRRNPNAKFYRKREK